MYRISLLVSVIFYVVLNMQHYFTTRGDKCELYRNIMPPAGVNDLCRTLLKPDGNAVCHWPNFSGNRSGTSHA